MEKILKQLINNYISPFLRAQGFKRRGNSWYRKNDDFTVSFTMPVDLEYTNEGAIFYLRCGVYSDELATMLGEEIKAFPKGYDYIFHYAIQDIFPPNEDVFHAHRNGENEETIHELKKNITKSLDFIANLKSVDALMDYCAEHNYLVHHDEIMRYFIIKKDEEKLQKYMLKIKEKLQRISDRAFESYTQKSLKLKAEYNFSS